MAYSWESSTGGKNWQQLEEDGENGIQINQDIALQRKREDRLASRPSVPANVRRGIIRHLCVCIDLSVANNKATDYRPSRMELIYNSVLQFIHDFFDVNPLSHMMIVVTKNSEARIASEMSPTFRDHEENLKVAIRDLPLGQPSIQRSLQLAFSRLKNVPEYAQSELLYLASALGTSDLGNVHDTIEELKQRKVRCSVIGLGGELHVLRSLAEKTGGTHHVAMHSEHYKILLSGHKEPPALKKTQTSNLAHAMNVGFPQKVDASKWDIDPAHSAIFNGGYECPKCGTTCPGTLPLTCYVCGLNLLSSPHIARSYHHLIKVPSFVIMDKNEEEEVGACYCCNRALHASRDLRYRCVKCKRMFAAACVDFMV
jgi:transcription initiation factor TFIIH subunit 2